MKSALLTFIALLGAPCGICAQDSAGSPDLFTLTFAPAPLSNDALPSATAGDFTNGPPEADPEDSPDAGGRERTDGLYAALARIEESIAEEVSLNGPQSPVLVERYEDMAALHEEIGNHLLAAAALEQARAIVRMRAGLHSLDQAEIVEQEIGGLESAGAFMDSDELQDDLLELAGRNDSDPRVLSIYSAVAERQMDAVATYLDEHIWPRVREQLTEREGSGWAPSTPKTGRQRALTQLAVIGDDYDAAIDKALADDDYEPGDPLGIGTDIAEVYELVDTANDFLEVGLLPRLERDGLTWEPRAPQSDREFASAALYRARRLYSAGMQAAYRQGSQSEYWALDDKLVGTYYFEAANPELRSSVAGGDARIPRPGTAHFVPLEGLLRARVADRLVRAAPPLEVARALLELGDTLPNRPAMEKYRQAYDFVVRHQTRASDIAALFHPDVPAIRRIFGPEDSAEFDPSRTWRGYVDVLVETGRYGQTDSVEVRDASPGTLRSVERRLVAHVLQTRFRPRFADGEPVRSDRFAARYYYDFDLKE